MGRKRKGSGVRGPGSVVPKRPALVPGAAAAAPPSPTPEWGRRLLLGLVTCLLVARPVAPGEDPGLLSPLSHPAGLVLTLLWLLLAVAWAVWRAWRRDGTWLGGGVGVALLAAAAFFFLSAFTTAGYGHPARLIAWEWAALVLAFVLVRQLARTPDDVHGLTAVLLATAVSLAAQAVYQSVAELPGERARLAADADGFIRDLPWHYTHVETADPLREQTLRRVRDGRAAATFTAPDVFAGYLALIAPSLAFLTFSCWKQQGRSWRTAGLIGCAGLVGAALYLSGSWSALLALLAVGGAVLLWRAKRAGGSWLPGAAALALCPLVFVLLPAGRGLGEWSEAWSAGWKVVEDASWLGVGPGNFGRHYPRYLKEGTAVPGALAEAPNFIQEVWASAGLFALLAVLAALGLFFRRALRAGPEAEGEAAASAAPRWEFYLGGVGGLLLAFVLRADGLPPEAILREGWAAAGRSVLWFAAFGLFSTSAWTAAARRLALTTGAAVVLAQLFFTAGFGAPALAQPFWVIAALALGHVADRRPTQAQGNWLAGAAALPLLAVLALTYAFSFFAPVSSCGSGVSDARRHYAVWRDRIEPAWREQAYAPDAKPIQKAAAAKVADDYLTRNILTPLVEAVRADPDDAYAWVELGHWYGKQVELYGAVEPSRGEPDAFKQAIVLDPDGQEIYLAEYRARLLLAPLFREKTLERQQYQLAADALDKLLKRYPAETRWREEREDLLRRVR